MAGIFDKAGHGSGSSTAWIDELLRAAAPRPSGLGGIFGLDPAPAPTNSLVLGPVFDSARRRAEWNDRFAHWEKPASFSEAGTIERAQGLVSQIIAKNDWLAGQRVTVAGQGSYYNNTNVRTEADIDLRVVHPTLKVDFDENVHVPSADSVLAYSLAPLSLDQIFNGLRTALVTDLRARFGAGNIDLGNKAIRIKGVTGSRAEVDVVPTVGYNFVTWLPAYSRYSTIEGVAIRGTNGQWTLNFPVQHAANGIAKRTRTACRFKKIVRVFKRLRADLSDRGLLSVKVPSFLVECLVYEVEDHHFLVETDDRYGRVRRVALRMQQLLADRAAAQALHEINEVKWLFHATQGWTHADALTFANAVVAHLGDA